MRGDLFRAIRLWDDNFAMFVVVFWGGFKELNKYPCQKIQG